MAEHKGGSGGNSSESGGNVNGSANQLLDMIKTVVKKLQVKTAHYQKLNLKSKNI